MVVVSSSESWPRCASGISSKALQGILGRGRAGREAGWRTSTELCVLSESRCRQVVGQPYQQRGLSKEAARSDGEGEGV